MTRQEFGRALLDTSISDTEFLKILLQYLEEQAVKDRKAGKNFSSIYSPDFQKLEAEMDCLRKQVHKSRPAIMEMMRQHVLKQHEHCCGPEKKK